MRRHRHLSMSVFLPPRVPCRAFFSAGGMSERPSSNLGSDLNYLCVPSTLLCLSEPQFTDLYIGLMPELIRQCI